MNKQQVTEFIERQIAAGAISKDDLIDIANGIPVNLSQTQKDAVRSGSSKNLVNIFYVIGAVIVMIGVGILVGQNWDQIGFSGRIAVSLGISFAAYVMALVLGKPHHNAVSSTLFAVSASLSPLGTYVFLNQMQIPIGLTEQLYAAIALTIIYTVALIVSRRNILILISIAFASWAYFVGVDQVFGMSLFDGDLSKWSVMIIGLSYLAVAYGLSAVETIQTKEKIATEGVLYAAGSLAVLGAGIAMGGNFDLIYIAIIFAAFYASVFLHSRSMLILAAIFLMAHIWKLTSEYFPNSLGWSLALIVGGFLVIGVGYLTYYLNKRFMSVK